MLTDGPTYPTTTWSHSTRSYSVTISEAFTTLTHPSSSAQTYSSRSSDRSLSRIVMASPIHQIGDLEINQDLNVQARMWRIQRVGWAIMLVIVLLALTGLFGRGPASETMAGNINGPLWVEYERFGRYQSPSTLRIHLQPVTSPGPRQVWISNSYLSGVEIQQIVPDPMVTKMSDDGLLFEVGTAGKAEAGVLTLYLQFQQMGVLAGDVRSPGHTPVHISTFVYP